MANELKKITDLPAGTPANTDVIPYVDLVTGTTKKGLKSELKGDTGTAATADVGTTTTGTAGSSASVVNSGTTSAAVFDFTIPKGDKGDKGDKGATGATGATGDTGTSATADAGITTTGAEGTSATVTNSGTTSAAVFDFVIPKGDKGDTGATGATGPSGADGVIQSIVSGTNTTVDSTDPANPIVSVTGVGDMLSATYDPTSIAGDVFDMDNMAEGATTKILTDVERTQIATNKTNADASKIKTDFISVTQAVDLDTIESDTAINNAKVSDINHVALSTTTDLAEGTNLYYTEARVSANSDVTANTAKVTNATHTGDVTGDTALTIPATTISGKTAVTTLAGTEEVLVNEAGTLKKTTTQDIADLGGGGTKKIACTAWETLPDECLVRKTTVMSYPDETSQGWSGDGAVTNDTEYLISDPVLDETHYLAQKITNSNKSFNLIDLNVRITASGYGSGTMGTYGVKILQGTDIATAVEIARGISEQLSYISLTKRAVLDKMVNMVSTETYWIVVWENSAIRPYTAGYGLYIGMKNVNTGTTIGTLSVAQNEAGATYTYISADFLSTAYDTTILKILKASYTVGADAYTDENIGYVQTGVAQYSNVDIYPLNQHVPTTTNLDIGTNYQISTAGGFYEASTSVTGNPVRAIEKNLVYIQYGVDAL